VIAPLDTTPVTTLETGRDFVGKLLLGLDPAGPE
jgi:hypothetical protein